MSLINDALKKAQNLQTRPAGTTHVFPRANPAPATEPANPTPAPVATTTPPVLKTVATTTSSPVRLATPAAAATPAPAATPTEITLPPPRTGSTPPGKKAIMLTVTSVLIVGLGALGYVVYAMFFSAKPETPADSPVAVAPATVPETKDASPAPAAETSPAPKPAAVAEAPATPASVAPAPAPISTPAALPTPATQTAVAAPAPAEPESAPAEEVVEERINNPKPHIQAWVDKINVSGIRAGERPKLLMNDRVFLVGELVSRDLGLRLSEVHERLVVFEDDEGNTYEHSF